MCQHCQQTEHINAENQFRPQLLHWDIHWVERSGSQHWIQNIKKKIFYHSKQGYFGCFTPKKGSSNSLELNEFYFSLKLFFSLSPLKLLTPPPHSFKTILSDHFEKVGQVLPFIKFAQLFLLCIPNHLISAGPIFPYLLCSACNHSFLCFSITHIFDSAH